MALEVTYEGKSFIFDIEDMDTDEARAMERHGVKNLKALEDGIGDGDIAALTVAYWLMVRQNGEPGARIDRVVFKPIRFIKALGAAKVIGADAAEDDPKED